MVGQRLHLLRIAGGGTVPVNTAPEFAVYDLSALPPPRSWCGDCAQGPVQPAVAGFAGVGISALIAWWWRVHGYFLLGDSMSLPWAVVFTLSVLIRRPAVGCRINGHDRLAEVPPSCSPSIWPPWTRVLALGARFVVQHHLYDVDKTGWLVAWIHGGCWPPSGPRTLLAIRAAQRLRASEQVRPGPRTRPARDAATPVAAAAQRTGKTIDATKSSSSPSRGWSCFGTITR